MPSLGREVPKSDGVGALGKVGRMGDVSDFGTTGVPNGVPVAGERRNDSFYPAGIITYSLAVEW